MFLAGSSPTTERVTLTESCLDFVDPAGVGVEDIQVVADRWQQTSDDPGWDGRYDLDEDGLISIADVMQVAMAWNSTCPGPALPPDPSTVAPPLDPSMVTDLATATTFLYTGDNPIQTGVVTGTIAAQRVALLRGQVFDRLGNPLSGVQVSILDHPEFGSTLTRTDGAFDMVVNGGEVLTVRFEKEGYLSAQRKVRPRWRGFTRLPRLVLLRYDTAVTRIDMSAPDMQVHRGSRISGDVRPDRQATLLFSPGTTATLAFEDGTTQPVTTSLHVRATEYTVGPAGPDAMPAELPPNTAYTYAVEFSADEAQQAGARSVSFSQPVILYVENFLGFPVGGVVPTGYYDRGKGEWIPVANGRIVKILGVTGGLADLDITGDDVADDATTIGVSDEERAQLAQLYPAGQSLWRVSISHFSPYDCNWPYGLPADADAPDGEVEAEQPEDDPCQQEGSIIECESQTLGQRINLVGTPIDLSYRSDRTPGRKAAYQLDLTLRGDTVPESLKRIEVTIDIAGQHVSESLPKETRTYSFAWDGKDGYGRTIQGAQIAYVGIGYVYDGVYTESPEAYTASFAVASATGATITADQTAGEYIWWQFFEQALGTWDARGQGLGGWTLRAAHFYDPNAQVLYLGDGRRRTARQVPIITTYAGGGTPTPTPIDPDGIGDHGPATEAALDQPNGIAIDGEGNLYIVDLNHNRVRMVDPDGIITTVAGTGNPGFNGDHRLATRAQLNWPRDVATDSQGNVYIADTNNCRIRKVNAAGIITTVAGNGLCGDGLDGVPATETSIHEPWYITVDGLGNLYIVDLLRIRKVGQDGVITTVVGDCSRPGRPSCSSEEDIPAVNASLSDPGDIAVDDQGNLYLTSHNALRKVDTAGIISTLFSKGDASFNGVAVSTSGQVFVSDLISDQVYRLDSYGWVTAFAGAGESGFGGDGGPAGEALMDNPWSLTVDSQGNVYISDYWNHRIRRVGSPLPGYGSYYTIPSRSGSLLYDFDAGGRHLRTRYANSGATLFSLDYDEAGRLVQIEDADGNVLQVERDPATGNATAIVAPGGQRSSLELDGAGYLTSISDPAQETTRFEYDQGLMTELTDGNGHLHRFSYDSMGRLTRDQGPAGDFLALASTVQGPRSVVTATTALSRTTIYLTENDASTGESRRTLLLADGTQSAMVTELDTTRVITHANGMVIRKEQYPDPRWGMMAAYPSLATVTTPGGLQATVRTTRTVNLDDPDDPLSLNTLTSLFRINDHTYSSVFDAASGQATYTTPEGRTLILTRDETGRETSRRIPGLAVQSYQYDDQGRLVAISEAADSITRTYTLHYDSQNRVEAITSPLSETIHFDYDLADRVVTQTLLAGRQVTFDYDQNGNLTALTPPGRPTHVQSYTVTNREALYVPPVVPGVDEPQTSYTYNLDRQQIGIVQPDGKTLERRHDNAGRLQMLVPSPGEPLSFSYDGTTGQLLSIAAGTASTLTFTYDGALPTGATWSGLVAGQVRRGYNSDFLVDSLNINDLITVTFGYDGDGLLTQAGDLALTRRADNGLVETTALGHVSTTLTYNAFGELTAQQVATPAGIAYDARYQRDEVGRITAITETLPGAGITQTDVFTFTYDPARRLAGVGLNGSLQARYEYDDNGNRVGGIDRRGPISNTLYDEQDRLLRYGDTTYEYTANGELLHKTSNGQVTTYAYDVFGNLRGVELPDGTQIDYVIDGRNRRIGKRVDAALVKGFLYDGKQRIVAELDGAGSIVSIFVYGSRANVPDYMVKDGVAYRIISDHLGSPRLVIHSVSGDIVQRIDYDEFGNIITDTNPGFQPFGFAGGLYDQHTRLTRFGVRDYDAETGRWTAKDLIRFLGGDTNLYAYAHSDPLNWIDPTGYAQICSQPLIPTENTTFQGFRKFITDNPVSDFLNLELAHEHIFFDDGSNVGYGPKGIYNTTDDIDDYRCEPENYDDELLQEAVDIVELTGEWTPEDYSPFLHNCQMYTAAVKATYQGLLIHQKVEPVVEAAESVIDYVVEGVNSWLE